MVSLALLLLCAAFTQASEWPRFRGPNGSGIAQAANLPTELAPDKNVAWKRPLPPGFSSPVLSDDRVFVTAYENQTLQTLSLDRKTGDVKWRANAPAVLPGKPKGPNSPASPTPATDGRNVYVFFDNFGLVSYAPDGKERWRLALGPFNFPYGAGSSPIIAGRSLILLVDQDMGSYLLAVDRETGKQRWKTPRSHATHGFSTPTLYAPKNCPAELIVSGAYELTSYSAETGRRLWWVTGMAWQAKSIPVISGDTLYVHSWMASLTELGHKPITAAWEDVLAERDADKDGKLSKQESPDESLGNVWFLYDLDKDGFLGKTDWQYLLARNSAKNGLYAIRLGGRGDVTRTHVLWRYDKGLPNIPSPLYYQNVLYMLREGGILTSFNPADGAVIKQARIEGGVDAYFASPIAADGKIITASKAGKVAVIKAGPHWETISVGDFGEEIWSTPAIAGEQIFVRTQKTLYCFRKLV